LAWLPWHGIEFNGFRNIVALKIAIISQNKTKTAKGGNFVRRHYIGERHMLMSQKVKSGIAQLGPLIIFFQILIFPSCVGIMMAGFIFKTFSLRDKDNFCCCSSEWLGKLENAKHNSPTTTTARGET
jgi:hypothetical protein